MEKVSSDLAAVMTALRDAGLSESPCRDGLGAGAVVNLLGTDEGEGEGKARGGRKVATTPPPRRSPSSQAETLRPPAGCQVERARGVCVGGSGDAAAAVAEAE